MSCVTGETDCPVSSCEEQQAFCAALEVEGNVKQTQAQENQQNPTFLHVNFNICIKLQDVQIFVKVFDTYSLLMPYDFFKTSNPCKSASYVTWEL